ncbi:hypothetical protein [Janthinobacterium sp.]|uniref:hypothetical protein n=1 Tax=Janthinobacterium sp. TaxID=1871054 RepID=UPI00258DBF3B|nr:hypothetical protein [Janthinobacterium sp.]MCX7291559.1 hypothetical protein [Janthinobacterium sp.]
MNVLSTPPIRIRMVPRNSVETRSPFEQEPSTQNELRYAFWRAIFQPVSDDLQADILEKKLRDIFGTNLQHLIINKLAEPLQQVTQALSRDEGGDIRELLIRYLQEDSNRDRAQYRPQTVDVAMRLIE